jgi:hypothetical protein
VTVAREPSARIVRTDRGTPEYRSEEAAAITVNVSGNLAAPGQPLRRRRPYPQDGHAFSKIPQFGSGRLDLNIDLDNAPASSSVRKTGEGLQNQCSISAR